MPKKVSPELKARALRMYEEHRADYSTMTAAAAAVAKHLDLGRRRCAVGLPRRRSTLAARPGLTSAELAEIKRLEGGEPAAA